MEAPFFVRVNQVLVRLWACLLAFLGSSPRMKSDRMPAASSERGDRSEATVVC